MTLIPPIKIRLAIFLIYVTSYCKPTCLVQLKSVQVIKETLVCFQTMVLLGYNINYS